MIGANLVPSRALAAVGRVLDFGARKHGRDDWRTTAGYALHYCAKISRHLAAYIGGERFDRETGEHHLAHAVCDALFVIDRDLAREEDATKEVPT